MNRRAFLTLSSAASFSAMRSAAAPPDAAALRSLLEPLRQEHRLPALAGAIVTTDGLRAVGVCGVRKVGTDIPATADDLWHLGSMTKAMTATLLGTWVAEGRLAWDDPISKHLGPLLAGADPTFASLTIRQLLSHRAGLAANRADWASLPAPGSRAEVVRAECRKAPETAPGSTYLYSNLGYVIAGAVAERLGGALWEKLIRDRLFRPLGMTAGFGGTGTEGKIDQPWPHTAAGSPTGMNGPGIDNPPVMGPAGTCHAALGEYAKFIADQLRGAAGGRSLLPGPIYRDLHTPSPGETYALGWGTHRRDWAGGTALAHTGTNTMNFFTAWLSPGRGFGVVAACNQGGDAASKACDRACGALIAQHLA